MKSAIVILISILFFASCSSRALRCADGSNYKVKEYRVKKMKRGYRVPMYASSSSSSRSSNDSASADSQESTPERPNEPSSAEPVQSVELEVPDNDVRVSVDPSPVERESNSNPPTSDKDAPVTVNGSDLPIRVGLDEDVALDFDTPDSNNEEEVEETENPQEVSGVDLPLRTSTGTDVQLNFDQQDSAEPEDESDSGPEAVSGVDLPLRTSADVNLDFEQEQDVSEEEENSDPENLSGTDLPMRTSLNENVHLDFPSSDSEDEEEKVDLQHLDATSLDMKFNTDTNVEVDIPYNPETQLVFNNQVYEKDEDIFYEEKIQYIPNYVVFVNDEEAYDKLRKLADILKEYPDKQVKVFANGGWDSTSEDQEEFKDFYDQFLYGANPSVYGQTIGGLGLDENQHPEWVRKIRSLGLPNVTQVNVGELLAARAYKIKNLLIKDFGVNKKQIRALRGEFTRINDHMVTFEIVQK